MQSKSFCTPHLISDGAIAPLQPIPLSERSFDEDRLQGLLFEHPSLVPVDQIESVFGPLVPLARELPTERGPIDVVYLNAAGFLTLIETKLWRNPEARREVVAQIIDYATAMSKWTYEQLREAARRAGAPGDDPLVEAVREEEGFDATRFHDTISRNLAKGRFLLIIAGDGIQESVESLAETVSRSPHLQFSLALLELAFFRAGTTPDSMYVQPRLLARTREIVRAVVEVRAPSSLSDIVVSVPVPEAGADGGTRRTLTEVTFLEALAETTSTAVADGFRKFVGDVEKLGLRAQPRTASVSLFWDEPNTGRRFTFGTVNCEGGTVDTFFVRDNYINEELDVTIGDRYVQALASLAPGATIRTEAKGRLRVFVGKRNLALDDLLPRANDWIAAIERTIKETESAGAVKAASAT